MADIELKITGLAELERALEELPLKAARRIVRQEASAAVAPWAEEMRAIVRRGPHTAKGQIDYGVIAANITQRTTVHNDLSATVKVGPAGAVAGKRLYWAWFLEFGTRARRRKSGASTGTMPAFPFVTPAYEQGKEAVLEGFISGIRAALTAAGLPLS